MLERSGIKYVELIDLVKTRFLNPHQETLNHLDRITLHEPGSACDLATTTLRTIRSIHEGTSAPNELDEFFSKIHRFVRLWRKTSWSIHELDTVLAALQARDVTPEVISQIADAKKIQEQTGMSVPQLAALWGTIDNYGTDSRYARLFLNKSVRRISDAFEPDNRGRYFSNTNRYPRR